MSRHPRQTKGPAQYRPSAGRHDIGHTDAATQAEDTAALEKALASKPVHPPGRHRFKDGRCVCGAYEVEST